MPLLIRQFSRSGNGVDVGYVLFVNSAETLTCDANFPFFYSYLPLSLTHMATNRPYLTELGMLVQSKRPRTQSEFGISLYLFFVGMHSHPA